MRGGMSKAAMAALRKRENDPERKAARRVGLLTWEYRALKASIGREPTLEDAARYNAGRKA